MSASDDQLSFTIRGMDCAGCARTIESGVSRLEGVEACEISFTTEALRVRGSVSPDAVAARVRELGYEAEPRAPSGHETRRPEATGSLLHYVLRRADTRLALVAALLILPGLVVHELLRRESIWAELPALVALLLAGTPVARIAVRTARVNRQLGIHALMTIAAVGAVAIGAYVEAGMVMVLFALGEAMEGYTATRARQAIRGLMEVAPETAVRLEAGDAGDAGREERVPIDALAVGDRILVRPGERIPMDGRVVAGASTVDQAPITGESRPVEKGAGADVFAGSINGEGALEVVVTRPAAENTIARMIRLVEEAQERRAPVERVVDRFARVYTPAVVVLAVLVATVPPLLFGQPFTSPDDATAGWLYRALALLVVACPCALVISTPVTVISALTRAARNGVLIKGGVHLEALAGVRAVAFDKTGTLTAGTPAVVAVRAAGCPVPETRDIGHCAACDDVLALAHAVERRSEHPLAQAIAAASTERGVDSRYPAAAEVSALIGRGITGRAAGRSVTVGSHTHFDANVPHDAIHCAWAAEASTLGHTPILIEADGRYLGTITVADAVRDTARDAVAELGRLGLDAVVMLTGDAEPTARRIGAELGVDRIRAGLLPHEKVAAIHQIRMRHGTVAMVGDGINDAAALAHADVGIAVGAAHGGTNQAMEAADVTLLSDDLRRIPSALRLARKAMRTVRANIAFSIGIKVVFLGLVVAGAGTLWMAVLADVGATAIVTLNGMRLLR